MHSDRALFTGKTHEICEDYAIAYNNVIVLSDGCSGSPATDFGSRILCATALNLLRGMTEYEKQFKEEQCILTARPAARILNLPQDCLDATLLMAAINENGSSIAAVYGDGVLAIKLKDGRIYYANINFKSNTPGASFPYYINYLYDDARHEDWHELDSERVISIELIEPDGTHSILVEKLDLGYGFPPEDYDEIKPHIHEFAGVGHFRSELNRTVIWIQDFSRIECIAIMSDGVGTFHTVGTNEPYPQEQVIHGLLNFRRTEGAFIQRRAKRFIKNCADKNIVHDDDVSIAALYLGE